MKLSILCLIALIVALISMFIGHQGNHTLIWTENQISTFAANAPNDVWVSFSIIVICFVVLISSVLVSHYDLFGKNIMFTFSSLLSGATISGLVVLVVFEETAPNISILKNSTFHAIRFQSFHDIGLSLFLFSAVPMLVVIGTTVFFKVNSIKEKIIGSGIVFFSCLSFPLMVTNWIKFISIANAGTGLKQRASLFSLWVSFLLFIIAGLYRQIKQPDRMN